MCEKVTIMIMYANDLRTTLYPEVETRIKAKGNDHEGKTEECPDDPAHDHASHVRERRRENLKRHRTERRIVIECTTRKRGRGKVRIVSRNCRT